MNMRQAELLAELAEGNPSNEALEWLKLNPELKGKIEHLKMVIRGARTPMFDVPSEVSSSAKDIFREPRSTRKATWIFAAGVRAAAADAMTCRVEMDELEVALRAARIDSQWEVMGRVSPESVYELSLDGTEIETDGEGRFAATMAAPPTALSLWHEGKLLRCEISAD